MNHRPQNKRRGTRWKCAAPYIVAASECSASASSMSRRSARAAKHLHMDSSARSEPALSLRRGDIPAKPGRAPLFVPAQCSSLDYRRPGSDCSLALIRAQPPSSLSTITRDPTGAFPPLGYALMFRVNTLRGCGLVGYSLFSTSLRPRRYTSRFTLFQTPPPNSRGRFACWGCWARSSP